MEPDETKYRKRLVQSFDASRAQRTDWYYSYDINLRACKVVLCN